MTSTTNDELDEKLARLGRRLEASRSALRAELERVGLLGPLDATKAVFSIKGRSFALRTDRMSVGDYPEPGITWAELHPQPLTDAPIRKPKGQR